MSRMLLIVYATTIFLTASLLFVVQPMFAKMVLPLLGGSPAVWTTCLVFYQAALLAGYLYAHATTSWLGVRRQAALHVGLVLLPLLLLPIGIPSGWTPPAAASPIPWLLALLAVAVGLPFFVVSTTSPLLQKWFAGTGHPSAGDPYFLYAASNLGSMLGLLGYPVLLEPRLRLAEQSRLWSGGYLLLLVFTLACAVLLWRSPVPALADPSRERLTGLAARRRLRLGAAGPGPLEPHAERDHVHLGRRRGHPAALGDSPGDLSPHLRPRVRAAAPRAPRPHGPRATHRAPGARRRAREARQPAAPPDHGAPSGGLLRGGDGVPRRAGARPPAARAPDRVLSLALGGWRPRRGLQRAGRPARPRQRGRASADRGFGVPARAGSPGWRPRAGCARRRTARGHRRGDGGTDRGDGVGRAGGRARRPAAGARRARHAVLRLLAPAAPLRAGDRRHPARPHALHRRAGAGGRDPPELLRRQSRDARRDPGAPSAHPWQHAARRAEPRPRAAPRAPGLLRSERPDRAGVRGARRPALGRARRPRRRRARLLRAAARRVGFLRDRSPGREHRPRSALLHLPPRLPAGCARRAGRRAPVAGAGRATLRSHRPRRLQLGRDPRPPPHARSAADVSGPPRPRGGARLPHLEPAPGPRARARRSGARCEPRRAHPGRRRDPGRARAGEARVALGGHGAPAGRSRQPRDRRALGAR